MSEKASRRRRFSLTRQGKGYVFVTVGVGVAAVNTGNNLLYLILGLLLSLLLVSGTLSDLALYQIRASRRVPARLYVGRPHPVELSVENRKRWLPSFSLELREENVSVAPATTTDAADPLRALRGHPPEARSRGLRDAFRGHPPQPRGRLAGALGGHPPQPPPRLPFHGRGAYVVRVPAASRVTVTSPLTPERRGLHRLGMLLVTTRYPFGLIEKVSRRAHPEEVLVYPEVRDIPLPPFPAHALGLADTSARRGHGPDTVGLRPHRPEDGARDIHWRRSASFGRLVSRERAADADRSLTLALDERPPADPSLRAAWDAGFEVAVSDCASLAVAALARGISVAIQTERSASPRVDPGGVPDPLLRFLALLAPSDDAGARADRSQGPGASPLTPTRGTAHSRRDPSLVMRVPVELRDVRLASPAPRGAARRSEARGKGQGGRAA